MLNATSNRSYVPTPTVWKSIQPAHGQAWVYIGGRGQNSFSRIGKFRVTTFSACDSNAYDHGGGVLVTQLEVKLHYPDQPEAGNFLAYCLLRDLQLVFPFVIIILVFYLHHQCSGKVEAKANTNLLPISFVSSPHVHGTLLHNYGCMASNAVGCTIYINNPTTIYSNSRLFSSPV